MKTSSALLLALAPSLVLGANNGLALTPPMGWRSWNCYHGSVSQALMEGIMDKMANKSRTVDGVATSLRDLGYDNCGLDDNWQQCGAGIDKSFHDADGNPIINTKTFPDMKAMTDHGHSLGLRVGWYMNNCICSEHQFKDQDAIAKHMQGSVDAIVKYGYDGVKLDGCGQFRNLTWWYQLMNATGRPILIENCHWGGTVPNTTSGDGPCRGDSGVSDCPYNFFRTSGDISNNWGSMTKNLATTTKFQGDPPLARPGTWAYPDMMEVGRMANVAEDRTHFGAWVITSSPLILGYDLNDESITDKIWPFVANKEAISVNQNWAGHPGRLVKRFPRPGGTPSAPPLGTLAAVKADATAAGQKGWALSSSGALSNGNACLSFTGLKQVDGGFNFVKCDETASSQRFTLESNGNLHVTGDTSTCVASENGSGPGVVAYGCNTGNNEEWRLDATAGTLCNIAVGRFPALCLQKQGMPVVASECSASDASQKGWSHDATTGLVHAGNGVCLDGSDASAVALSACDATNAAQVFAYDAVQKSLRNGVWAQQGEGASAMCLDVYDFKGPGVQLFGCNYGRNEQFDFNADGTLTDNDSPKNCLGTNPSSSGTWQLWTKKQPNGALAVFVINGDIDTAAVAATVNFAELVDAAGGTAFKVRDVWARKDLGSATGSYTTAPIGPHDSVLLLLTPQ